MSCLCHQSANAKDMPDRPKRKIDIYLYSSIPRRNHAARVADVGSMI